MNLILNYYFDGNKKKNLKIMQININYLLKKKKVF